MSEHNRSDNDLLFLLIEYSAWIDPCLILRRRKITKKEKKKKNHIDIQTNTHTRLVVEEEGPREMDYIRDDEERERDEGKKLFYQNRNNQKDIHILQTRKEKRERDYHQGRQDKRMKKKKRG